MRNFNNLFSDIKGRFDSSSKSTGWNTKSWSESFVKQRSELIKPYLHWLDSGRLNNQVQKHMTDDKKIDQMYSKAFNNMRKINRGQLIQDTKDFYEKEFPKELIADIFNLYYKDSTKLDYEERSDKNQFRYKVLDNVTDPIGRMISEGSNVKSMIMTRSMVQYFSMLMAYQKQVNPEEFEQMKNQMQGKGGGEPNDQEGESEGESEEDGENDSNQNGQPQSGKGNSKKKPQTPEEMLQNLMKDSRIETLQEEILNEAKQNIDDLSEVLSDAEQEAIWKNDSDEIGFDKESIQKLLNQYLSVQMNMKKVKDIITKLLNKTRNYFNGKEKPFFESMFEAASIDGLEDYALLHPKLRKLMAEDVMVKDVTREGKINVYIDCSGSMDASMSYNNTSITGMNFAKSFAIQMLQMDLIEKVYYFDTNVYSCDATQIGITAIDSGGGTSLEKVIRHIDSHKANALVITDAYDSVYTYTPYAYFIGILGASFSGFNSEVMPKYSAKAQAVEFDGEHIYNITEKGQRGSIVK